MFDCSWFPLDFCCTQEQFYTFLYCIMSVLLGYVSVLMSIRFSYVSVYGENERWLNKCIKTVAYINLN